jgi:hypothetical protein
MKLKSFIFVFGLFIGNISFGNDEAFDKLLTGNYHYMDELVSSFSVSDATDLIELARETTVPKETRKTCMRILAEMREPSLFRPLVDLYDDIRDRTLAQSNHITGEYQYSSVYYNELLCFKLVLVALGRISSPESIEFLKEEFKLQTWESRKIENYTKSLLDDQIRLKVFIALAEAAVYTPSLFAFLEDIQNNTTEVGFRRNMDSLLPEFKEKYYQKNPNELPEKGYFLVVVDNPQKSIDKMSDSIEKYFKLNQKLPSQILDFAIRNGGNAAYIYGDRYNNQEDKMLVYKMMHGIEDGYNIWTYVLLSVGPNGKIDVDLDKMALGMHDEKQYKIFKEWGDDIFDVLTYVAEIKSQ